MTISALSIISGMLSLYCCFKAPNVRVPTFLRFIAFNVLAKIFFLQHDIPKEPEFSSVCENVESDMVISETERAKSVGTTCCKTNAYLQAIVNELSFLKNVVKEQESENFITNEWKCFGKVMDRFLFWLCLCGFVLAIICIYA